jgi:succinate dehydrogenase hydrophobic anchor subunit
VYSWLAHPVKEERFTMRFKKDQAVQATAYYFHHYACHWASPAVAATYRSVPQVGHTVAAAAAAAFLWLVLLHACMHALVGCSKVCTLLDVKPIRDLE